MCKKPEELITIVIPVFNRAGIVCRTLQSVYDQQYRPLHLVVVDNNSTDDTLPVVMRWADSKRSDDFVINVVSQRNPGASAARNRGLAEVVTPYVLFFDSDDVMSAGHLSAVDAALRQHPEADIVGWDVQLLKPDGRKTRHRFEAMHAMYNNLFHGTMSTIRYVARTELVRSAGGWNEALRGWDDWELGVRMLKLNPKLVKIENHCGALIYPQAESITGTDYSSHPERWEAAMDAVERVLADGPERYLHYVACRRAILAGHYLREGHRDLSDRIMSELLGRTECAIRRSFYRFVCRFTAVGGRGVALMAPLFNNIVN